MGFDWLRLEFRKLTNLIFMKTTSPSLPENLNRRAWMGRMTAATVGAVLGSSVTRAEGPKTATTHVVKRTVAPEGKGPRGPMGFDEAMF